MWDVSLPVAQTRPRLNKAPDLHQATQSSTAFFIPVRLRPFLGDRLPPHRLFKLPQVWHSLQTQPGTPLLITSVLCSPGLRPLDRNSKSNFRVPLAATFWSVQPGWRLAPQPSHLLAASVPTWWTALPGPPLTRAAGQPELGFSQTTVTPRRDAGLQQLGSLQLWASHCHFALRHLHPPQPHWTPPSRTAALGTIPAAHWLLPRQPRATPLPIGPALFRAIFVRGPVFWVSGPKI